MPLLATPALALAFAIGPALRIASPRAGLPCATAADSSVDASPSLKEQLVTAIGSDGLASAPSLNQQMEITEVIMALSSTNPTAEPARSPLLNGKWELQFSGAPGQGLADSPTRLLALALYSVPLSPSVLAQGLASLPFGAASLGSVTVEIVSSEAGQPRVTVDSSVSLLGGTSQPVRRWGIDPAIPGAAPSPFPAHEPSPAARPPASHARTPSSQVVLRANLMPRSGTALREDFVEVEALGQRSLLPGPLAVSRSLYVAYLDQDLLIMRDEAGLPTVLRRSDKFAKAPEEPSYAEDDSAPGVG